MIRSISVTTKGFGIAAAVLFAVLPCISKAADFVWVSDTISDSRPSASADHVLAFSLTSGIPVSGRLAVRFANAFGALDTLTAHDIAISVHNTQYAIAPSAGVGAGSALGFAVAGQTLTFTLNDTDSFNSGDAVTIKIGHNVTGGLNQIKNPIASGSYAVNLASYDTYDRLLDRNNTLVAIIDAVGVSAGSEQVSSPPAPTQSPSPSGGGGDSVSTPVVVDQSDMVPLPPPGVSTVPTGIATIAQDDGHVFVDVLPRIVQTKPAVTIPVAAGKEETIRFPADDSHALTVVVPKEYTDNGHTADIIISLTHGTGENLAVTPGSAVIAGSHIYRVRAYVDSNEVKSLPHPISLTVAYSEQNFVPSSVALYSSAEGSTSWRKELGTVNDLVKHTITIPKLTHLTYFTVMGVPAITTAVCGGDLNNDGKVDLVDFSILLYNWGRTTARLSNPRADINMDGKVDLHDLSILLYCWTG